MKKGREWLSLLLAVAMTLCLAGCQTGTVSTQEPVSTGEIVSTEEPVSTQEPVSTADQDDFDAALELSLGQLSEYLTDQEREAARQSLEEAWTLRQQRLESGAFEPDDQEREALSGYSQLLDLYTEQYLDVELDDWYEYPEEVNLVNFLLEPDGTLEDPYYYDGWEDSGYTLADAEELWETVRTLLPDGAFAEFEEFQLFTDGKDETLAYIYWDDNSGVATHWGLAIDPADVDEWEELVLTVLHEYAHYLTLQEGQVAFVDTPGIDTYSETGMESAEDSYLNSFYQAYWGFLYEERRQNMDSTAFYTRHEDRFCDEYASTDPAEDIAESFAYFVLMSDEEIEADQTIRGDKWRFFLDDPDFVDFRAQVRAHLNLEEAVQDAA